MVIGPGQIPHHPHSRTSIRVRTTGSLLAQAFGSSPFSLREAEAIEISRDRVERACSAGIIQRVARGLYSVIDAAQAHEARLTALLKRNPGLLACGSTAASIWGIPLPPAYEVAPDVVEVTFLAGASGRRGHEEQVVARRWFIPDGHVTAGPTGQLVTDPLRTAIDLARGRPLHLALIPLDAGLRIAMEHGLTRSSAEEALISRWNECRSGNGMRAVGRAIPLADPLAESPLESMVRGRLVAAHLPTPHLQVPVIGASGRHYRADMGLDLPGDAPGTFRLLIEADGMGKYASAKALADEKRRQHDLERAGRTFVRVLYDEALYHPGEFLGTIDHLIRP